MSYSLVISFLFSFIVTYFLTPHIIKYFKIIGLTVRDFHKKEKPLIPWSIGIPVLAGLMAGILFYIFLQVFFYNDQNSLIELFAGMTTVMIATFVGFLDDLNVRDTKFKNYDYEGEQKTHIMGLSPKRWVKPFLTLPAAIPLMVINAGHTTAVLPFLGTINFGILYPLLILPLGVLGATNMVNMIGGYNGLEGGMGAIYTLSLGIFAFTHGSVAAAVIFLSAFAALLAILKFNFFPAKILSGDSLQYLLGAVIVTGAVVGDMQKATFIAVLPIFLNAVYKIYLRFSKLGYFPGELSILQKDGTLKSKYSKSYTIINFILHHGRFTERQLVLTMMGIEVVFCVIPFLGIF
jgi:UDP-N-acetylglucosamine--dolichyl-phosphate N-acetylglucosaminephosphotransferase